MFFGVDSGPLGSKVSPGDGRSGSAESGMGPAGILAGPPVSKVGPVAGMVRAHLPANPLFSVSGREPRAGFFGIGGPAVGMVRARLPASPLVSVSGREPRAGCFEIRGPAAGFFKARFAPPSSRTLAAPSRGANSSHKFRAAGPGPAGFFKARFAPPSSQTLAAPFRGANSSHKFRADACLRRPFQRRGLLPANRKPLQLRFREQILHINSAPPSGAGRFFQGAVCSPLPASPCSSVPGSKFFTQIPRLRPGTPGFFKARFAPRSPLALVAPFRGANSSHKFRAGAQKAPCRFIGKVLPSPQQFPRRSQSRGALLIN